MGGNFTVERRRLALAGGLLLMWGWMALGATHAAEGFWTTGRGSDWHWLEPRDHARWEFFTLPAGGNPHVAVEAFLCLAVPNGSAPPEIAVRFQIGTAAGPRPRLWVVRMHRIQANEGYAMYFGQLFLCRREIGLGSRLTVRLDGAQSRFSLGVHPGSVRISGGGGASVGPEAATGGWTKCADSCPQPKPRPREACRQRDPFPTRRARATRRSSPPASTGGSWVGLGRTGRWTGWTCTASTSGSGRS